MNASHVVYGNVIGGGLADSLECYLEYYTLFNEN